MAELLIPGATSFVQKAVNPNRSTGFDLISIEKEGRLFNIDSQIPNRVFSEWAQCGGVEGLRGIWPERTFGRSRFDFFIETEVARMYVEIKGVTLLKNNVALFPDAPTERGVRHVQELCQCVDEGFEAMIVFVIQTENPDFFAANDALHAAFGEMLRKGCAHGVQIRAIDCIVTPDRIDANKCVPVRLQNPSGRVRFDP